jgi:hypothetical protein
VWSGRLHSRHPSATMYIFRSAIFSPATSSILVRPFPITWRLCSPAQQRRSPLQGDLTDQLDHAVPVGATNGGQAIGIRPGQPTLKTFQRLPSVNPT